MGNKIENMNLQSEKKEWITPILVEEDINDKTENSFPGAGADGTIPGIMQS